MYLTEFVSIEKKYELQMKMFVLVKLVAPSAQTINLM